MARSAKRGGENSSGNGGIKSSLRWRAGGHRQCDAQRQGDEGNVDSGNKIRAQIGAGVAFEVFEKCGGIFEDRAQSQRGRQAAGGRCIVDAFCHPDTLRRRTSIGQLSD